MLFAEYRKKIVTQASILFLVSLVVILVVPSFLHAHPERELIHDLLDLLLVVVTVLFLESVGTRRWVVVMGGTVTLLKVVDMIFNRPLLHEVTEFGLIMIFMIAIIRLFQVLIRQSEVDAEMILASVSGYLCLGFVFAIVCIAVERHFPGSFHGAIGEIHRDDIFYFSFITLSSVGYGDVVPVRPEAKSVAILIALFGQLYIAVVMAMLVGKYVSRGQTKSR